MIRFAWIFSWFVLIYFLVDARLQIHQLEEEIQGLSRSPEESIPIRKKKFKPVVSSQFRTALFSQLHEINRLEKKIRYRPGELWVDEMALSKDDRFLDLLDFIYENEKLILIEIPRNNEIRKDLKLAGFGEDFVQNSKDSRWKIRFKDH